MSSRIRSTVIFALVLSAASVIAAQIPSPATNVRVTRIEPVIWAVTASAVTSSQVTINWTTDLASDWLVEYGLTTSYGSTTTRNATLVTAHAMTIAGLLDSRLYHFRVRSREAGGIEECRRITPSRRLFLPTDPWTGDHEEGTMSDWYVGSGGGEFNSGGGVSAASTDVAHTGKYSAKATISTPPSPSAVRLFRWAESRVKPEAYYGAWFYFPQVYTTDWWFIDQFKSRSCSTRRS